jgi:hypothetical protein
MKEFCLFNMGIIAIKPVKRSAGGGPSLVIQNGGAKRLPQFVIRQSSFVIHRVIRQSTFDLRHSKKVNK